MLIRKILIGSVAAFTMLTAYGLAPHAPTTATQTADTYAIDPVHSSSVFRIKHNNVANFYGRFDEITGTISFDEASPGSSSIEVAIPVASVNTGNEKRNGHLKQADFFDAEKFPKATFKSTSFAKGAGDTFDVTGDLTIHGVTKPITIKLEKTGQASGERGQLIGFETTFSFSRKDFGITYGAGALGDDVRLTISLEATKK